MMTFLDHLLELRSKILLSVFAIIIGAVVAHFYHEKIIDIALKPIGREKLFFLSPLDPLFFILKIDLFAGCILAVPFINWNVLAFLRPAMNKSHWFLFSLVHCMAAVLLLAGLAYAYFVIVPLSLKFLMSINIDGIQNMITATSYLNFLLTQSLIIALIFQIPLFVIAGSFIGALHAQTLATRRRYIYVTALVVLAVITPTIDLFNLAVVAVPAAVIFEGSIVAARFVEALRRRKHIAAMSSQAVSAASTAVPTVDLI